MARKKSTKKSSRLTDQNSVKPLSMVYSLLYGIGVVSSDKEIIPNYVENGKRVGVAVPGIKFCLSFDNDDSDYFSEQGWNIEYINHRDLEAFARVFSSVMAGRIAQKKHALDPNVKNTSEAEEKLLNAILWRGIPTPDRNKTFYRDDGTELTTPDFTWEEYKVAFYLDGAYWHSVMNDSKLIKELKSNAKHKNKVIADRSDKVIKDNNNRSELTLMGYRWIVCSDKDVSTPEGIEEQVDRIEKLINTSKSAQMLNSGREHDRGQTNDLIEALSLRDDEQNFSHETVDDDRSVDEPDGSTGIDHEDVDVEGSSDSMSDQNSGINDMLNALFPSDQE